jgi:hypothetical protein
MSMSQEECPNCLGAKQFMKAKESKGFQYVDCPLCYATGLVPGDVADDYVLSLNEDAIIDEIL